MTKKLIFYLLLISSALLLLSVGTIWARMESANYVIWADVFSSGGTEDSTSANYSLSDTIGEAIILSATSTSVNYGTKAGFREMYPDQYLTLSVSATAVDLGTLSTSEAKTGSHTMTVATNAVGGFTTTVLGSTLTSGANDINAIGAAAAASTPGTEQFGINLVANTSPSVGANPNGTSPIGSAANQYNTADFFAFHTGDTVATSTQAINSTIFAVSYLANIATDTVAGSYSTTLTYSATANF